MLQKKPNVPMSPEQLAKRQQAVNDMNLRLGKNWAFSRSQPPAPDIVERAGRKWQAGAAGAPPGWRKQVDGPGWMGPHGEYWDGTGTPPWQGWRPGSNVEGEKLFYPHGGGAPVTKPGPGIGYSFEPRGAGTSGGTPPQQAAPPLSPFTQQSLGPGVSMAVPNMAWGEANGMVWDGKSWQRRDPNEDLQRRMLEMELEKRQQDIAHEAWKRAQEKVATEWALNQQMHPQNQGGVPMIQRDSDGDGIDNNGIPMYGDQPKRRRRAVPDAGRAQPVLPPDQGTPYGAPMPAQPQRMAPASDYDMFRPRNMLPESGRAGQFLPPEEELAWMEKNLKDMEAALAAGNTAAREDVVRLRRVIAELKGGQAGGSAPQAGSQTPIRAWNDPSNPRYAGRPPVADGSQRLF